MKFVLVKIFIIKENYAIHVTMGSINDNRKLVEKDFFKSFDNYDQLKLYVGNFTLNMTYFRCKVFVDFIVSNIILESMVLTNISKNNKIKDSLNEIYPNFSLKYNVTYEEKMLRNKNKQYSMILVPKTILNTLSDIFSLFQVNKKMIGLDVVLLQQHLNKNMMYFFKKKVLLIQKNYNFWRFYKIVYGKIVDYIVCDENDPQFPVVSQSVYNDVDTKYDEIIVDSDYRTFIEINEKIKYQNVVFIEYINRLKNIDERKINYAKASI